ncbi:enoyl-CoA hydratase [Phreatobacter stygius]|uniref:Enoyl-CoA hydratase n=1 Tax=Phreatobacter stygius TaxID=1940610 RepID=A0A4D7B8J9_9HYPH|nr:enoyl-CoA hydratase [Phreatobacter stygius]QCI66598.1 enoyl-CoA hydratase [Phreatobacter stygius]
MSELDIERRGSTAVLTLNRPQAMNALSGSLMQAIARNVSALGRDDTVRAIIVTGAGERAFSAGLDLKELGTDASTLGAVDSASVEENPVRAIETCPKPVIAAINGVAITGGFELALACDVLIASTSARFADTHGRVGVIPGWGLSQKLPRLVGVYRAKEISFTGNFIDARTACDWGLVNRVVEPGDLMPAALKLAGEMAQVPAAFLSDYKRLIDDGFALPYGEAMALEQERSRHHNGAVSASELEARRANVQARGRSQ